MRLGTRAPFWLQRRAVALAVRIAQGSMTKYGLPKPDRPMLCAPPTISDSLLSKVDHGDIAVKPGIDRFDGDHVYFADGTVEQVDAVIYATGYKICFPFLGPAAIGVDGSQISLYRRVVPPELPGLYFIGLVQPVGALMPIAEAQSEWVADLLQGRATLPPLRQMHREIASITRLPPGVMAVPPGMSSRWTSWRTCGRSAGNGRPAPGTPDSHVRLLS